MRHWPKVTFQAGRFYLEQANQQGTSAQDVQQERQQGQSDLEQALGVPKRIQDRMAAVPKNILADCGRPGETRSSR